MPAFEVRSAPSVCLVTRADSVAFMLLQREKEIDRNTTTADDRAEDDVISKHNCFFGCLVVGTVVIFACFGGKVRPLHQRGVGHACSICRRLIDRCARLCAQSRSS